MPDNSTTAPTAIVETSRRSAGEISQEELLAALRTFRNGDFSVRLPLDRTGIGGEIADAFNEVVAMNQRMAQEFDRISGVVGRDGRLSQRISSVGTRGSWASSVDSVNMLITDLTQPVTEVSRVLEAVAKGDLTQRVALELDGRPLKGEFLRSSRIVNTMVDQLNAFASEVTRVAREVGTEGKLGGQARVKGVAGTWKDLTDSVNFMASNLTSQVRNIADVTTAVANGDLSKKITVEVRGEILELKNTINTMVDQLNAFASEVTRVAREVGSEGKLGGQANVKGVAGTWKDLTDNVNLMAGNLTSQVRNIADVTTAVANGDLSKKITVDVRGEILELKNTINTMVDQLNAFASEVTRMAREVGTEGRLGGQAEVKGVAGTWKDLTDSVNSMASNLTSQVRNIAEVTTAVANGDLSKKITVDVRGEILELKNTINTMVDQLNAFASEVTRVAREVGVEGELGGQANVKGVAGTWKDLTDNVNQLAANLTTQVRAIGEVAIAVTKGDLSRSIAVEAQGELELLKDTVNEMIVNLRETTQKNTEQDWLKTNLARFTGMLQGQRDLQTVAQLLLSELAPLVNAQHGVFYVSTVSDGEAVLELLASYACEERTQVGKRFKPGEGLIGQAAYEKERILLTGAPNDYIRISSGLGSAPPLNIVVLPVLFEQEVKAVVELASFNQFSDTHLSFLDQLTESIGIVVNTIEANARTEDLLKQSQALATELQMQQQELQQTNEELEEKARLLSEQNAEVQRRTREIEEARVELEQKAQQLALTSQYKSQFLANMSHEVRTPLNSILILSQQLAENTESNLTPKQIEFADTIHGAGNDLMALINDILDLSKIESGTSSVEPQDVSFGELQDHLDRTFRPVAEDKHLEFSIILDEDLPSTIYTDPTRIRQVLKNLLSNAVKFTDQGGVDLRVSLVSEGWSADDDVLNRAKQVIAFAVRDTGIGIPPEKQAVIFEAFQQADMTTARKFGGTGLGLSISREVAQLLGGEIRLSSEVKGGSIFTLYLPLSYQPDYNGPREDGYVAASAGVGMQELPSSATPASGADRDSSLEHMLALIIDDDMRNVFALSSLLERHGMRVAFAESGKEGVQTLLANPEVDVVLMDIMMPGQDGYETIRRIRALPQFQTLPIIAVTARAMREDREKCIEAGASDYISKPVDVQQLLSLLRMWLQREPVA